MPCLEKVGIWDPRINISSPEDTLHSRFNTVRGEKNRCSSKTSTLEDFGRLFPIWESSPSTHTASGCALCSGHRSSFFDAQHTKKNKSFVEETRGKDHRVPKKTQLYKYTVLKASHHFILFYSLFTARLFFFFLQSKQPLHQCGCG